MSRITPADGLSVAVVTPSFNQARHLASAIDSVLAQEYPNLDYLVVDAMSSDGTAEVLAGYGDRIRWISNQTTARRMPSTRRSSSTGDIVGWLNSDDVYLPGALRTAVKVFEEHPEIVAVYGEAEFIDSAGNVLGPCTVEPFGVDRLINVLDYIVQPATFFRRSAYLAVGGLDRRLTYCLDYDLWIRLAKRGRCLHVTRPLAQVRNTPRRKPRAAGWPDWRRSSPWSAATGRSRLPRQFWPEMVRESRRAMPARSGRGTGARHGTRSRYSRGTRSSVPPSRGPRDRPVAAGASRSACGSPTRDSKGPRAATPTRLATGPLLASFRCGHGACPWWCPVTSTRRIWQICSIASRIRPKRPRR